MPAKEIVEKAKAAGVKLTTAYVYVLRSQSRKKRGGRKVTHRLNATVHVVGSHKAEDLLRAVAAELGLANAIAILRSEHDRVHRMLRG